MCIVWQLRRICDMSSINSKCRKLGSQYYLARDVVFVHKFEVVIPNISCSRGHKRIGPRGSRGRLG